jgi:alpha-methylacyl-CoA racemase
VFAAVFRQRTRAHWCTIFDGTDACVAPVLAPTEAHAHPHNVARRGFLMRDGVPEPAPGPRFSAHPDLEPASPEHPGAATADVLAEWGVNGDDVAALQSAGVLV